MRLISDDPAFEAPGGSPGPVPDILGDLEFLIAAAGGGYTAARRNGKGGTLTAPDRDGLMDKIEADYTAEPVPRDVAADTLWDVPPEGRP